VVQALDGLGTAYQSVFDLDGAALFDPRRRNDVPRLYREAAYRDRCGCFAYAGLTYPMP
jgi:hypothetical protein